MYNVKHIKSVPYSTNCLDKIFTPNSNNKYNHSDSINDMCVLLFQI